MTNKPNKNSLGRGFTNSKTALFSLFMAAACLSLGAQAHDPVFKNAVQQTEKFGNLHTLHIAQGGAIVLERGFNGHSPDEPTNVKSASKSLVAALVGIAINKGILEGVDQPIAPLLRDQLPDSPDPRINQITIGHLLAMRAGLERTSGKHYGAWVTSKNWVQTALNKPFVDDPGGRLLYSTGNTHLLSAILMRETGRSTYELANDWLGPAGIKVDDWMLDPQGIPLGGNQVFMTPKSLLALGELYRRGGITQDGVRLFPQDWVTASWNADNKGYTREGYGYGWLLRNFRGYPAYYGWGYGGQMLYVVPALELTVVVTSDANRPSEENGYLDDLNALLAEYIMPEAEISVAAAD